MRKTFLAVIFLFLSSVAFADSEQILIALSQVPTDVDQVVIVTADTENPIKAKVSAWGKENNAWVPAINEFDAVIGRNGLAAPTEKREGDGKAPAGLFNLRRAFGYEAAVPTKLDYHQVTEKDLWVDDTESPQYNQWITESTTAKSFERLRRDDDLYKYAIVIEYNTDPIVPGLGSAIFMHVWRDADQPTAGCVAMEEKNILALLKWLDAEKKPVVVLQ